MVSVLASRSSGPGLSPCRGHCVVLHHVLLLDTFNITYTVPFSIQVYKWVPANLMLGNNPMMY